VIPQVAATAGPLNGRAFPIAGRSLSVGRDLSNQLPIQDGSISRRHCVIVRGDESVVVRDLASRNGTYVNGLPVRERVLQDGDEIQIGSSVLVFQAVSLPSDEPDVDVTRPLSFTPAARNYDAVVRMASAISSVRGLVTLGRPLLALVADAVPARRGAIILGARIEDIDQAVTWNRPGQLEDPVVIDRAVIEQVARTGAPVLAIKGGSSIIAAPLRAFRQILGAIYLEGAAAAFDQEQLQLVDTVAAMAGLALHGTRQIEWLETENQRLQAETGVTHQMVGRSRKMQQVYDFIVKVAPTASTVLIRGESGTGKELVARAIHRNSGRAQKPFMAINCAALAETLLESELFGYEKGAFTGAVGRKAGKFEVANGGTVFLDEVGELPLHLQAKLLRVLQEREFERVGGTQAIKVDIRLVAATNRELEEAVKAGLFRSDLYYRLNVVSVTLPPLRERREDILPLAKHFASRQAERCQRRVAGISEEAAECLANYYWPGNVRELENAIERAVVLGSTPMIVRDDLGEDLLDATPSGPVETGFHDAVRRIKREIIVKAFEQAGGQHTSAAKTLGLNANYLHRLIRILDLKTELKG
jgi:transcriptional regulator with GAF, ATPase, and Fis domain